MGVVINNTLNCGCGLLCLLEKWMQNQLNCSSISIGSSQLFKTPGELRQLLYEKCMWDFLARGGSMEPLLDPPLANVHFNYSYTLPPTPFYKLTHFFALLNNTHSHLQCYS